MEKKTKKIGLLSALVFVALLLASCAGAQDSSTPTAEPTASPTPTATPPGLEWDPVFVPPPCRADGKTPLLDEVLALSGLTRAELSFSDRDWRESAYHTNGYLSDEFMLRWFSSARANPARLGCVEGEIAGALDYYLSQPHPVAGMIRHATILLGHSTGSAMPFDPRALPGTFDEAIEALCAAAGGCGPAEGELPPELKEALAPLIWAIIEGIEARARMDMKAGLQHDAEWWYRYGGNRILLTTAGQGPDPSHVPNRNYLLGVGGRDRLYRASSLIAYAIEHTDWSKFAGMEGVEYGLFTEAGWIRVRDGASHVYADDGTETLLFVDLGGDDVYLFPAGANRSGKNPVSVAIDLGGNDVYAYEEHATPFDSEDLPPADRFLRYKGDDMYGPVSLSDESRQGGARNGIAMLFDLGDGNDRYQSLRASQAYAHLGVGILFDEGGSDVYLSEAASQGSAQFGIAILVDAGEGSDSFRSFTQSQGFGYVAGAGFLVNEMGEDSYVCDHGDPSQEGTRLYFSPQRQKDGNSSFCQGAGLGMRGDDSNARTFLSGGVGVLRDMRGNDTYEGSVFAQGAGYWQGTGILSDGEGSDIYDAYWYVQGAAAHFAVGILADAGSGNDVFNGNRAPQAVHLGSGHDYSVGFFVNEEGNDTYHIATLGAGSSNCNGIGVFVDNSGDDAYISSTDYSSGMGNVSGECVDTRPNAKSVGIMIDAGGTDAYEYPTSPHPIPQDGGTWGHRRNDLPSEHGAGIDSQGETGMHAESTP